MTNQEIAVEIVKLALNITNVIEENVSIIYREEIAHLKHYGRSCNIPLDIYYDKYQDNFFAHYAESFAQTHNITKVIELFRSMK